MPYVHGPNMPKKSFFENELNDAWREAREKGIEYGIALGHKDGTQENDRKGMLYVACEMQDLGCMAPSDIDVAAFNRWREYVMSDRNRRGKAISESGFKKRKEALIVLLKALDLIGPQGSTTAPKRHQGQGDPVLEQGGAGGHDPACHGGIPQ